MINIRLVIIAINKIHGVSTNEAAADVTNCAGLGKRYALAFVGTHI